MNIRLISSALAVSMAFCAYAADPVLTGTLIGTGGAASSHAMSKVADNDPSTFYHVQSQGTEYSRTWVGYDLGARYVITKVKFASAKSYENCLELGIFEGANQPDFSDAMPIAMVRTIPPAGTVYTMDVNVSRGFRYVRFMSPANKGCTIAELQFCGHEGNGDDSKMFQVTNLPTVVVNTQDMQQILSKDHKVDGYAYIISDNGTNLQIQADTEVKGRGNGSWTFPKKPYRLKFNKKASVLDAKAEGKKWTLINNYGDKTLMRNKLAFDISEAMQMAYTPYCRFVDVVLNGQYEGCYQLCDQIDVRENRVDITEMAPEDITLPELSGGYLVEIDAYATSEASWFRSNYGQPVTIKSPDDDEIVKAQSDYIRDHFNKMEQAVMTSYSTDADGGYTRYLDLDSYLKFVMINELAGNTDILWSVYMYKQRNDDHFYTGPVWDFDIAFENDRRVYPVLGMSDYMFNYKVNVASSATIDMFNHILSYDQGVKSRLRLLWSEARQLNGLTAENICDNIDRYAAELQASQELTFRRWPILDQIVHQNQFALGSFDSEVEYVKDFVRQRIVNLDDRFGRVELDGIEKNVTDPDKRLVGVYDLYGRRVENPGKGIYIERYSDGTSAKVYK